MAIEHDINLVTSQARSVIVENQKVTLGLSRASITPATIQAMIGISNGQALRISPDVTSANLSMVNKVTALRATGTNNPIIQLSGNITVNIGDYLTQTTICSQINFSNSIQANVGEYITQTTIINQINFSGNITAVDGQYVSQTLSGANAVVVAATNLANVLSISYTTSNVFILSSGNVYISGIDANVYPTNTSANIIRSANATVVTGNNSLNTLFVSYLNANTFTLSSGNITARAWTGNVKIGNIDANVYPNNTSTNITYLANAFVFSNVTNSSNVTVSYVTRPNVFVLGSGNIQYSGNLTIVDSRANIILYPNIAANVYPSSIIYPGDSDFANITQSTVSNLQSLQDRILPAGNHAALGQILQQAQEHINTATDLTNTTNFLANISYSDFGSGITDMSSMGDHGLTNTLGSLSGAGSAIASTGSMFNGIAVDKIGTPGGLVESIQNNKLANAVGLNQKLIDAGVDLNNIHDPVYADKISGVLTNIKDPASINTSADQFGINDPFAGLPSYTGSDSSLYKTPTFLGGNNG